MKMPLLTPNSIIEGKWGKNRYEVKEKIGQGGIAVVYLVKDIKTGQEYAMKISKDIISINREYELLKKFDKVDMIVKTYGIDDLHIKDEVYYYILLEAIKGANLKDYSEKNKFENNVIVGIILVILKGLKMFYDEEYIIGDLKLENFMLDKKNNQLKMIDLGGVVKKGQAIKEFTPVYDRSNWKCGDRIGEISYSIFAVMIIFIKLILKEPINPKYQSIEDIIIKLKKKNLNKRLQNCIINGIFKKEDSLEYFIKTLETLYYLEKKNQLAKRYLLIDKSINIFLCFSVVFFIVTIIFLFLI